jgi:hypothetical protein
MSSGKAFLEELFEEGPISSIIPQRPRSGTRTMMKQKGKMPIEKQVDKHVQKKLVSKAKENQKMLQWMKMNSNEFKWARRAGLENLFNLQWTTLRKYLL